MTTATTDKRKALGRGLDSLLPKKVAVSPVPATPATAGGSAGATAAGAAGGVPAGEAVQQIPVELIDKNPFQTRSYLRDSSLNELVDSIKSAGVIEPLIVRAGKQGRFQLIAGQRRLAASQKAGKSTVPAVVVQVSDEKAMEMTIIENLQREDLNAIDQAQAFERLSREFGLTQEEMSRRTGISRSEIANYLRLLKLPGKVQLEMHQGEGNISFGHAKVLLTLMDPGMIEKVAQRVISEALSVRQLEDLCFDLNHPIEKPKAPPKYVDPNVREAEKEMERALGVRVKIKDRKGRGKIVIEYKSLEDFDRVVEVLAKK